MKKSAVKSTHVPSEHRTRIANADQRSIGEDADLVNSGGMVEYANSGALVLACSIACIQTDLLLFTPKSIEPPLSKLMRKRLKLVSEKVDG